MLRTKFNRVSPTDSLIVVLNDKETYSDISGCMVQLHTQESVARVDQNGDPRQGDPIAEISVADLLVFYRDHVEYPNG